MASTDWDLIVNDSRERIAALRRDAFGEAEIASGIRENASMITGTTAINRRLKAPTGFLERARTMNSYQLHVYYEQPLAVIDEWLGARKVEKTTEMPVPDDFAEQAKTKHAAALARHYCVTHHKVNRWLKMEGITPISGMGLNNPNYRPIPEDFLQVANGAHVSAIAAHYRAGLRTVLRWVDESGAQPRQYRQKSSLFNRNPGKTTVSAGRNYTPEDLAADVLRNDMPVYRCTENGTQKENGPFWRVGNTICDGAELLARAERKKKKGSI